MGVGGLGSVLGVETQGADSCAQVVHLCGEVGELMLEGLLVMEYLSECGGELIKVMGRRGHFE